VKEEELPRKKERNCDERGMGRMINTEGGTVKDEEH
jgi:hypothetical protein